MIPILCVQILIIIYITCKYCVNVNHLHLHVWTYYYCFDSLGFRLMCLHLLWHALYFLWMDFHPCLYVCVHGSSFLLTLTLLAYISIYIKDLHEANLNICQIHLHGFMWISWEHVIVSTKVLCIITYLWVSLHPQTPFSRVSRK